MVWAGYSTYHIATTVPVTEVVSANGVSCTFKTIDDNQVLDDVDNLNLLDDLDLGESNVDGLSNNNSSVIVVVVSVAVLVASSSVSILSCV